MTECPRCRRPTTDADLAAGRCAQCGGALEATKSATVADVRVDQTMDFAVAAPPADGPGARPDEGEPKTGTVHEAHGLQTMNFDVLFGDKQAPPAAAAVPVEAAPAAPPAAPSASPVEPKTGTVHEAHGLQTMNFDALFGDAGEKSPAPRAAVDPPPSGSALGKKTNVDAANLAATYDSGQVGSSLVDQLSMVWGNEIEDSGAAAPHVTIKGKEITRTRSDQTLVINSRAVRDNSKPLTVAGAAPPQLADYELLSLLGEGGMGVVYTARQASIDRTVAVKMLKPGIKGNRDLQQKFLAEAVVTGDLDHPNIVPMYDLGKNEAGDLFYAMKRVQGTPWHKAIAAKSQAENVEILLKAADAVAFAHSRGVIHRDLKPENIMLGEFGEVLVMDWGLAYSTAAFRKSASITQTTSMGGSPAYMAPEMAVGPIQRITYSSDIYLLGAILYEILTGKPPHTGGNVTKCLMSAARNEIVPTDKTGELIDVALKAMATQPTDRYPTVAAFQAAIRECLAHSESLALAHRAEEELAKAGASGDYQHFSRALFGFEEAYALWSANSRAADGVQTARLRYAEAAFAKGDYDLAAGLLDRSLPAHAALGEQIRLAQAERDARHARLRRAKRFVAGLGAAVLLLGVVAYFGIRSQRDRALVAEEQAVVEAEKARSAEQVAVTEADRAKKAETLAVVEAEKAREAEAEAVASRDEAQEARAAEEYAAYGARIGLAAARIDENAFATAGELLDGCPPHLRGWEWGRLKYLCGRYRLSLEAGVPLNGAAVDAAGTRVAAVGWNGVVRVWNLAEPAAAPARFDLPGMVHAAAFAPAGDLLAVGGADPKSYLRLLPLAGERKLPEFVGHTKPVLAAAFNRAGDRLLSASADGTARLWDTATGKELRVLRGHTSAVTSAVFSPDEKTIVTTGQDATAIVWSPDTAGADEAGAAAPKEVRAMLAHRGPVQAAAFAPDGLTVATASADGRVLLWRPADVRPYRLAEVFSSNPPAPPPVRELTGHREGVLAVAFSPDGSRLAAGGVDNALIVWDVASGKALKTLRGHAGQVRGVRFLPDNRRLVSVGYDGSLKLWDVEDYDESIALRPLVVAGHADAVLAADFAPDERSIVTAGRDRTARISDVASLAVRRTLVEGHEYLASTAAVTPDGRTLVTAAVDGTTRLWDLDTGTERNVLRDTGRAAVLALSDDGKLALTGDSARGARLWNLADGKLLRTLPPHRTEVSAAAISPDGKLLCIGETSGRVNAYDAATGKPAWSRLEHSRRITGLLFTSDGGQLLSASLDNTVGRWNTADGSELRPLIWKHPGGVTALTRVDAEQAATACDDGRVRLWKLSAADAPTTATLPEASYGALVASPDGRLLAAVDQQTGVVRLFDVAERRELGVAAAAKATSDDSVPAGWLDSRTVDALIWNAAFTPDGKRLVTVGGNEALVWRVDGKTPPQAPGQALRPHGAIAGAAYAPDGRTVATAGWDGAVKIWNTADGRAVRKLAATADGGVNGLAYSRDGRRLLTVGDDGGARIWNTADGELLADLTIGAGRLTAGGFDKDGKRIVVGSIDGTARIWDVAARRELHTLRGHERAVLSAEFSRDGRHVVTAGADDTARVWNAADGKQIAVLAGHTAPVNSASFSADGARVVTGARDSGVKVWEAASGKELLSLKGHAGEVHVVRFSPTGRTILSAGADGTAILWPTVEWKAPR